MTGVIFAVRRELLEKAYADPVYGPQLEKAQTVVDVVEILARFCRESKRKVVTIAA